MFKLLSVLAVAFLPFVSYGQVTESGVYVPTVSSHSPGINPIPQLTHFIRIGDEVFVTGNVFLNGFPATGKKLYFTLSTPYSIANVNSLKGVAVFTQASPGVQAGYIQGEPSIGLCTVYFYATFADVGYLNFHFAFSATHE
jgi:hypothetical protein